MYRGRALLACVMGGLCTGLPAVGCGSSDDRAYTESDAAAGSGGTSGTGGTGGVSGQGGVAGIGGAGGAAGIAGTGGTGGAAGAAGASCELGTPDHCGGCDQACPGPDNTGTRRTCSDDTSNASCDIVCLGDSYDLDGDPGTGCEALDEPDQGTVSDAVEITLPDANDPNAQSNPLNVVAYAYGDDRKHEPAPADRPFGTPDWWSVTAVGQGDPDSGMVACLGIVNFPSDTRLELCISDIGMSTFEPSGCVVAEGQGPSVCVNPPAGTDAGGPYLVRVQQTAGTRSPYGYAVFLKH